MEMNDNTAVTQENIIVTTTTHKHLKELCRFLSEYAAKLLSSGTTTIRTEKNVVRIAESYGALADFAVLPNEIMLTLWDCKREHSYTVNCKISETSLNFDAITRLSALSWKISDNNLSLDEAWKEYENILRVPRLPFPLVTFLVGCANASFCRLFNGDWIAMAIVFVATVCGFYLKHEMVFNHSVELSVSNNKLLGICVRMERNAGHRVGHQRAVACPRNPVHQRDERPHLRTLCLLPQPFHTSNNHDNFPFSRTVPCTHDNADQLCLTCLFH